MLRLPPKPLYAWQSAALRAWVSNGRRGIIAAATGTGKTVLALHAMATSGADRVVVVVPTRLLQDQWVRILRTQGRLQRGKLGQIGGPIDDFRLDQRVVVAVINSARGALVNPFRYWRGRGDRILLVIDECHWAGSPTSLSLFEEVADHTLGLSATPERSDDGLEELLIPHLGSIVFRYSLRQAMDDGTVSGITAKHRFFDLAPGDQQQVDDLLKRLTASGRRASDPDAPHPVARGVSGIASLSDRKSVGIAGRMLRSLRDAQGRMESVISLIDSGELLGRRAIIFNETVQQAERIANAFRTTGNPCALEHSRLSEPIRRAALDRFAAGAVSLLVTVRALDEGIDIPDANTAVIVSGSLQVRQRTQRIGRIARACDTDAEVISILARNTPEQWEVPLTDVRLLGPDRVEASSGWAQ